MIILFSGRRGCGKTLSMVFTGLKMFNDGWKVYSNFETSYSDLMSSEEILSIDKNSKIRDCVLMLDEIQIFFDSRRSMKKQNISFSNFIQQIRKRNIILIATTQYTGTIDLRFRQHIDVIAKPNYIEKYKLCELKFIDVTATETEMFYNPFNNKKQEVSLVFDALKVFPLYDTNTLI